MLRTALHARRPRRVPLPARRRARACRSIAEPRRARARQGPARARRAGEARRLRRRDRHRPCRPALAAAERSRRTGSPRRVVDARFVKPLDEELIAGEALRARRVVTVEEGCLAGRLRRGVPRAARAPRASLADGLAVRRLGLPDAFVTHGDAGEAARRARARRGGHRARLPRARRAAREPRRGLGPRALRRGPRQAAHRPPPRRARARGVAHQGAGARHGGRGRRRARRGSTSRARSSTPALPLRLKEDAAPQRYVSRGALKLERALEAFPIDPRGKICADLGASTGGFTDLLLQRGAAKVYAVDVGYGQLHARAARRSARRRARARERAAPRRGGARRAGRARRRATSRSSRSASCSRP